MPYELLALARSLVACSDRWNHSKGVQLRLVRQNAINALGRGPKFSFLLTSVLVLFACGHPATEAECMEIFNRSCEIQLRVQNVTEPQVVRERIAEALVEKGGPLLKECVGKRITEGALECIRQANTLEQFDECFR
jgi:hypothetical protein